MVDYHPISAKDLCQKRRNEKRSKNGLSKKPNHARQLRGIYFIEPADEELKETIEHARRKLEAPMPTADQRTRVQGDL